MSGRSFLNILENIMRSGSNSSNRRNNEESAGPSSSSDPRRNMLRGVLGFPPESDRSNTSSRHSRIRHDNNFDEDRRRNMSNRSLIDHILQMRQSRTDPYEEERDYYRRQKSRFRGRRGDGSSSDSSPERYGSSIPNFKFRPGRRYLDIMELFHPSARSHREKG